MHRSLFSRLETSRRNARLEMAGDDSDDESDDDETLANAVAVVTGMKSKENVNQCKILA